MTEQVIVALMSSQLNDETALAIIISKPFVRVVKVEFVVWRLLCLFNLQNEIEGTITTKRKRMLYSK